MMKKIIFVITLMVLIVLTVLILMKKNQNPTIDFSGSPTGYSFPVTHTWYTSLFYDQYSKPLFAVPLDYSILVAGIQIGKPVLNYSAKSIVGSHSADLTIKALVLGKTVTYAGEWDVKIQAKTKDDNIDLHIIKGSPSFYFEAEKPLVISGIVSDFRSLDSKNMLVKVNNSIYLVTSKGSVKYKTNEITIDFNNDFASITLLPDEYTSINDVASDFVSNLQVCAMNQPSGTSYNFAFNKFSQKLSVTDIFSNDSKAKYLFTIWPHQQDTNNSYKSLGTYNTVRGKLTLTCANNLSYNLPTFDIPTTWKSVFDSSKLSDPLAKDLFNQDLADFNKTIYPDGVYFKGKYIKSLIDLSEIADSLNLASDKTTLENKAKDLLLKEVDNFTIDPKTNLLISKTPEFGNEKGNDHNLQYGYYIYSYAKMFNLFSDEEKQKVNALITLFLNEGLPGVNGTANYSRKIRFLDPMESHSWADAQALFEDGNNQESSSEALFYWYSWYIWGTVTSNTKITDWGKFAYFSELAGRNAYWFMVNNKLNDNFTSPIISLVWGGKDDYATWFSLEDNQIFGIQILPPNPGDSVAFKLPSDVFSKISSHYDNLFGKNPESSQLFGNYYAYFKKINGDSQNINYQNINEKEFFPRSLLFLLHML